MQMALFRQPRLILCWHAKICSLLCTSMIDSPQIPQTWSLTSFFFSLSTHTAATHTKTLNSVFLNFSSFHSSPPWFLRAIRITKTIKPIFQLCLQKFYFGFTFTHVKNTPRSSLHSLSRAHRFFLHAFLVRDVLLEDFILCMSENKYVFYDIYECDQSGNMLSVWAGCSQTWSHCDQNFQFWGWLIHQLGSINWHSHLL